MRVLNARSGGTRTHSSRRRGHGSAPYQLAARPPSATVLRAAAPRGRVRDPKCAAGAAPEPALRRLLRRAVRAAARAAARRPHAAGEKRRRAAASALRLD